jgi:hypothetical protein
VLRLLARNPRAGIGFIKFGARGVGPAMKAFNRGDDERGLRVFVAAVAGKERVAAIPEETFQAFVGNVGPFKAPLRAGFPQFGETMPGASACRHCSCQELKPQLR